MHRMDRESLTYVIIAAFLTFMVAWFGLSLVIRAAGVP